MSITVLPQDLRYNTMKKGHNLRWPATEDEFAGRIVLAENAQDAAEALQKIVSAGMRPTVRSGGHCYEDFAVNNPGGAMLDMSLMTGRTGSMRACRTGLGQGRNCGTRTWSCTGVMA